MSKIIFFIFLFILVFSPLAFGTVEPWSLAAMEILAMSAAWAYISQTAKEGGRPLYDTPGITPLFIFICYMLIQVLPMPVEFVKLISPSSYAAYDGSAGVTGQLTWITISVHPKATLSEFMRFASYAAFYVLTVQLLTKGRYLKRAVVVITLFGAALALFAMCQAVMTNGKIYWFREVATGIIFGPFVNRNHYAGLMSMIIPVAFSLFIALKPVIVYDSLRNRISDLLSSREVNNHILMGIAAVIMTVSVFLSLSRGGIISLCAAIAFFYLLMLLKKGNKKTAALILLVSFIALLVVGWFGWAPIFSRFQQLQDLNLADAGNLDRIELWKNSIAVIKDFPLTGSGFGSLSSVYPGYETEWTEMKVFHSHNDYIQLVAEGGIIALVLAVWFMCAVLYKARKVIPGRRDAYSIFLYMGSLAGIFSILVFSLADFNMHIGSNALYFFFLMGLVVSASHTRLHRGPEPTFLRKLDVSTTRPALLVMSALLFACLVFNIGVLAGQYSYSSIKTARAVKASGPEELAKLREDALRAGLFDPLEARYQYAAGVIEIRLSNIENAVSLMDHALTLDPMNSEYMQRLGQILYRNGQTEAGDRLILAGTVYDPSNPERYKFCAIHLFQTKRQTEAVEFVSKAISITPGRADDLIMLMMLRGLNAREIRNSLPERAAAHIAYAVYLVNSGKQSEADKAFGDALYYAGLEKRPDRAHFVKISGYYVKRELFDNALVALKQGIALFPNDSDLHYNAGVVYEKLNMNSAAMQEYKKAVALNISNTEAQKRIDELERKSVGP
jgi:O-antigen ligase/tetratricopeptide (TPR) repeat protein